MLDVRSKNGLRADGIKQHSIRLEAGMVIHVGDVRLVAESKGFSRLRCCLSRLIGWGDAATLAVEEAMQEIRAARLRRDPLVIVGEGDLGPIVRELHVCLFGQRAPFIMSDEKRAFLKEENEKQSKNCPDLREATSYAVGGSVFIRSQRVASTFRDIVISLREHGAPRVQLIVGGPAAPPEMARVRCAGPIVIPSLSDRRDEIESIIKEYYESAMDEFGAQVEVTSSERAWIRNNCSSYADIAKATRRLLALRLGSSILGAATYLKIAPVSLRRWLKGKAPPPFSVDDPDSQWLRVWQRVRGER